MTEQEDGVENLERDWPLDQDACKAIIEKGETAYGLLLEADPNLARRFRRLDTTIVKLLDDVRQHFPDASYYTGSGGFNLLLGSSHTGNGVSQQELIALSGNASIGDGDF